MIKYFIFSILIILILRTSAQECKYIRYKVDDFTGEKLINTENQILHTSIYYGGESLNTLLVSGLRKEGEKYLVFLVRKKSQWWIKKGSPILIKCEDKTIELYCSENVAAKQWAYNGRFWYANIIYEGIMNLDVWDILINNKAEKVRITFTRNTEDITIDEKNKRNISKVLNCLE